MSNQNRYRPMTNLERELGQSCRPITNLERLELNCQRLRAYDFNDVNLLQETVEESLSAILQELKDRKERG